MVRGNRGYRGYRGNRGRGRGGQWPQHDDGREDYGSSRGGNNRGGNNRGGNNRGGNNRGGNSRGGKRYDHDDDHENSEGSNKRTRHDDDDDGSHHQSSARQRSWTGAVDQSGFQTAQPTHQYNFRLRGPSLPAFLRNPYAPEGHPQQQQQQYQQPSVEEQHRQPARASADPVLPANHTYNPRDPLIIGAPTQAAAPAGQPPCAHCDETRLVKEEVVKRWKQCGSVLSEATAWMEAAWPSSHFQGGVRRTYSVEMDWYPNFTTIIRYDERRPSLLRRMEHAV